MTSHIICLSKSFIEQDKSKNMLIPIQGNCPNCEKELKWGELILGLKHRKIKASLSTNEMESVALCEHDQSSDGCESDGFEKIFPIMTPRKKVGTGKELATLVISSDSDDQIQEMKKSLSNLNFS
jgi:hypothetical protein